jgi:hypothetical protein
VDSDLSGTRNVPLMIINEKHPIWRNGNAVHDRLEIPRLGLGKPDLE